MIAVMEGTVTGAELTKSGKGHMVGVLQDQNGKQAWVRIYTDKAPPKAGEKLKIPVRVSGKDFMVSML